MLKRIKNYDVIEKIGETRGSLIYRGRKTGEKDTVVIKTLKTHYLIPSEIARFKQEYEIIKNIHLNSIIKIFDISHIIPPEFITANLTIILYAELYHDYNTIWNINQVLVFKNQKKSNE